jgi:hypothetical protein
MEPLLAQLVGSFLDDADLSRRLATDDIALLVWGSR